jgi:hypothetical protein
MTSVKLGTALGRLKVTAKLNPKTSCPRLQPHHLCKHEHLQCFQTYDVDHHHLTHIDLYAPYYANNHVGFEYDSSVVYTSRQCGHIPRQWRIPIHRLLQRNHRRGGNRRQARPIRRINGEPRHHDAHRVSQLLQHRQLQVCGIGVYEGVLVRAVYLCLLDETGRVALQSPVRGEYKRGVWRVACS